MGVVVWRGSEFLEWPESPFNTGLGGFCRHFKNTSKNRPVIFLSFFEKAIDL